MGPVPDLDRMANTAFDQIATMWRVTQCVDFGADRSGFAPYQDTSIRVIDTKDIGWSYTEPPPIPQLQWCLHWNSKLKRLARPYPQALMCH